MMKTGYLLLGAAAAASLCGCGKGGLENGKAGDAAAGDMAALSEISDDAPLPNKPCTPALQTPPRKADAPVDDVVGLRPGMPVGDIKALLRCRGNMAEIVSGGSFYMPNPPDIDLRQQMIATSGTPCDANESFRHPSMPSCDSLSIGDSRPMSGRDDQFMIALVGMPGKERAEGVWRTQDFDAGEEPVGNQVIAKLTNKYGEPNKVNDYGSTRELFWVHDLRDRPMSENNPSFRECLDIDADRTNSQRWTSDCGITVTAKLQTSRSNQDLIEKLSVAAVDQAGLTKGVEAVTRQIAAKAEKQRQDELEQARENAAPVEL